MAQKRLQGGVSAGTTLDTQATTGDIAVASEPFTLGAQYLYTVHDGNPGVAVFKGVVRTGGKGS